MGRNDSRVEEVVLHPEGLANCQPNIHRLGRRGSHVVYRVLPERIQYADDPSSKLKLFPIEEVFLDRCSVLIGCGTPNVATSMYRYEGPKGPGWYKFAAFMFWRQPSFIAPTKGRIQAGLYLELRNLSDDCRDAIWQAMNEFSGKRGPSCARLNGLVLDRAGFTLGNGKPLTRATRPSKYASLLWRYGILYKGQHVDVRIVLTTPLGTADHMKGVWLREVSSPQRTVRKLYEGQHASVPAPVFEPRQVTAIDKDRWSGEPITIGVNRPGRLGANLSFVYGQQPVYTLKLPTLSWVPELRDPLTPFPGKLDRVTKLKKHVLFSRPVISAIRASRHRSSDYFHDVPAGAAIDMLQPSIGPDHDTAILFNCVVTLDENGDGEAAISPLKNQDPASQDDRAVKTANWIMAKHVLISGYHPRTVFACELWCYYDENDEPVLCLNNNSGTYKPDATRLEVLARYIEHNFDIRVETSLMGG